MSDTIITTNEVRISYANIYEPKSINGSEAKYGTSILFNKMDAVIRMKIEDAVAAAVAVGKQKYGNNFDKGKFHTPLRDGDEERPDDEAYKGMLFLNANSKNKPRIYDKSAKVVDEKDFVYSGCYVRCILSFYPYSFNGNKGVSVSLGDIQKLRDGERLGGMPSGQSVFKDEEKKDPFAGVEDDDGDEMFG